jgi:hypothetical protein
MADITDNTSFQDLRAALTADPTPTPVTPVVEAPEVVVPPVVETTETPATEETPVPVVTEPLVDKKPKRFSQLTRELQDARQQAADLASRLAAVQATPAIPATPAAPVIEPLAGKPTPPDAGTFTGTWAELETARAEYTEKLVLWSVQNDRHQRETEKAKAETAKRIETVNRTFQQQYDAAVDADEHAETAVKNVAPIIGKMGIADVVKESEVAMEIILALDADPKRLEKIQGMSLASAAREIGRIEDSILAKRAAPVVPVKAKLPNPPVVVGGAASGSAASVDLEKLDMREFKAAARAQLKR